MLTRERCPACRNQPEGYGCPVLNTLFLAHPVSFNGSMVQYVGQIRCTHPGETTVGVQDYLDAEVGVLAVMRRRRSRSYTQLGFTTVAATLPTPGAS